MTNSSKEKAKKDKIEKIGKRAVFNPKDLQQCPHLKELAHEFDPWHSPRRFNSRTLRSRLSLIGLRASHLVHGMDSKNNMGCVYAPLSSPLTHMGLSSEIAPGCQASKDQIDIEDGTATMMLDNHGFIGKSPMLSGEKQNQMMATRNNTQVETNKETIRQNLQVVIDQDNTTVEGNAMSTLQTQPMEAMTGSSVMGIDNCGNNAPPVYTEQELNEAFDALGNCTNFDDFEPFNSFSDPPLFVQNSTYRQGEVLGVNDPFSPTYNQNNEKISSTDDDDYKKINNFGDAISVASITDVNVSVDLNNISNNTNNSSCLQFPNLKQVANHPNDPSSYPPVNTSSFHDVPIEGMIRGDFKWDGMMQRNSLYHERSFNLDEFDIAFGKSDDFGF